MSIIDPSVPVQELQNTVLRIKQNNLDFWKEMDQTHRRIFNMVWHNKDFTPKQIIDAFGKDAADLFIFSGDIQNVLAGVNPSYEPCVPTKPYTINQDGTVTVEE